MSAPAMLAWLFAVGGATAGAAPAIERPNLVVIVTDDQGYGDFGHAGNPVLRTPHLDALRAASPRVERFYVSPVCSPTRASLLTGRWNYRTRVVDTWVGRSMMEPDEWTLAEALKLGGYVSGIFGKWHLGDAFPMRPQDQGFDEVLVHRGGGLGQPSEPPENERRYTDPILFRNGVAERASGFCTDVYFDAALEFIDASVAAERPFFAYIATNAPHDPLHDVPQELYDAIRARDLEPVLAGADADKVARTYAMIENIDANVGRLLAHLDERELAGDTVVVFLNDNGPTGGRYNAGLRGSKSHVYEGGIRTPLFVRWPGRFDPATTVEPIGAHVDLFPTLLELAGIPVPNEIELDGRSLVPLLAGETPAWPDRHIVLQSHRGNVPSFAHHFALIGPRFKLVRPSGFGRFEPASDVPFELYDLLADPGESRDVAADHPEVARELRAAYARWFEDVATTRPDNWAPPRIVLGTDREPATVLTKQDWRTDEGQGWGRRGAWHVNVPTAYTPTLRLLFTEERQVDEVFVDTGSGVIELAPAATGRTIDAGPVELPAGEFVLIVTARADEEPIGLHQIVLER